MTNIIRQDEGAGWVAFNGDCVEAVGGLPNASVGYSIFSPPFASLYTHSASDRDMGNCANAEDFGRHLQFLVPELFRVLKPGRLVSMHCMLIPTSKAKDGIIGLNDFHGDLIRLFQDNGFIFHSDVVIWKDPVQQMQRTKALGLLHKTVRKDSAMSRQGLADYLVTFFKPGHAPAVVDLEDTIPHFLVTMRKPGENPEPIAHDAADFPVELWQRYASPVWVLNQKPMPVPMSVMLGRLDAFLSGHTEGGVHIARKDVVALVEKCRQDLETRADDAFLDCMPDIIPGDTLQGRSAREEKDERHICPLQLEVIRRGVRLWSNPGDVVLSPFGGIGSEGYVALQERRRAVLCELKGSYYAQLTKNLASAEPNAVGSQLSLI